MGPRSASASPSSSPAVITRVRRSSAPPRATKRATSTSRPPRTSRALRPRSAGRPRPSSVDPGPPTPPRFYVPALVPHHPPFRSVPPPRFHTPAPVLPGPFPPCPDPTPGVPFPPVFTPPRPSPAQHPTPANLPRPHPSPSPPTPPFRSRAGSSPSRVPLPTPTRPLLLQTPPDPAPPLPSSDRFCHCNRTIRTNSHINCYERSSPFGNFYRCEWIALPVATSGGTRTRSVPHSTQPSLRGGEWNLYLT